MIYVAYHINTDSDGNKVYNIKLDPYAQSFSHQSNLLSKLMDYTCVNKVIIIYISNENSSVYYVGLRQKSKEDGNYEFNNFEWLLHPLINGDFYKNHFDNNKTHFSTSIIDAYNTRLKVHNSE